MARFLSVLAVFVDILRTFLPCESLDHTRAVSAPHRGFPLGLPPKSCGKEG